MSSSSERRWLTSSKVFFSTGQFPLVYPWMNLEYLLAMMVMEGRHGSAKTREKWVQKVSTMG